MEEIDEAIERFELAIELREGRKEKTSKEWHSALAALKCMKWIIKDCNTNFKGEQYHLSQYTHIIAKFNEFMKGAQNAD